MTSVIIRWAGPAGATSSSAYKIERTTDNVDWTTLAASQAATAPYASHASTIAGNVSYGATAIDLADGSAFSTAGYGWLDRDALVQWTGRTGNQLTGVTWHSGYGTYAAGAALVEAHESYADDATISDHQALYRITHTANGQSSAPAYLRFWAPPAPVSADHCVVAALVVGDVGMTARAGISITCQMQADSQFASGGAQLDQGKGDNSQTTDAFGAAYFQCWKSGRREAIGGGAAAAYQFILDSGTGEQLVVTAATIPDRDWVLLRDIGG